MSKKEKRIEIIDTNVPMTAGNRVADIPDDLLLCAKACIEFIQELIKKDSGVRVVLDSNHLVLNEYEKNIKSLRGEDNLATYFLHWIYEYLAKIQPDDFFPLTELSENEYAEYPNHISELKSFDPSDKKFIALAFVHKESPVIIEATDSKWWGIKDILKDEGIEVMFLCEEYIKEKFEKKIDK